METLAASTKYHVSSPQWIDFDRYQWSAGQRWASSDSGRDAVQDNGTAVYATCDKCVHKCPHCIHWSRLHNWLQRDKAWQTTDVLKLTASLCKYIMVNINILNIYTFPRYSNAFKVDEKWNHLVTFLIHNIVSAITHENLILKSAQPRLTCSNRYLNAGVVNTVVFVIPLLLIFILQSKIFSDL